MVLHLDLAPSVAIALCLLIAVGYGVLAYVDALGIERYARMAQAVLMITCAALVFAAFGTAYTQ